MNEHDTSPVPSPAEPEPAYKLLFVLPDGELQLCVCKNLMHCVRKHCHGDEISTDFDYEELEPNDETETLLQHLKQVVTDLDKPLGIYLAESVHGLKAGTSLEELIRAAPSFMPSMKDVLPHQDLGNADQHHESGGKAVSPKAHSATVSACSLPSQTSPTAHQVTAAARTFDTEELLVNHDNVGLVSAATSEGAEACAPASIGHTSLMASDEQSQPLLKENRDADTATKHSTDHVVGVPLSTDNVCTRFQTPELLPWPAAKEPDVTDDEHIRTALCDLSCDLSNFFRADHSKAATPGNAVVSGMQAHDVELALTRQEHGASATAGTDVALPGSQAADTPGAVAVAASGQEPRSTQGGADLDSKAAHCEDPIHQEGTKIPPATGHVASASDTGSFIIQGAGQEGAEKLYTGAQQINAIAAAGLPSQATDANEIKDADRKPGNLTTQVKCPAAMGSLDLAPNTGVCGAVQSVTTRQRSLRTAHTAGGPTAHINILRSARSAACQEQTLSEQPAVPTGSKIVSAGPPVIPTATNQQHGIIMTSLQDAEFGRPSERNAAKHDDAQALRHPSNTCPTGLQSTQSNGNQETPVSGIAATSPLATLPQPDLQAQLADLIHYDGHVPVYMSAPDGTKHYAVLGNFQDLELHNQQCQVIPTDHTYQVQPCNQWRSLRSAWGKYGKESRYRMQIAQAVCGIPCDTYLREVIRLRDVLHNLTGLTSREQSATEHEEADRAEQSTAQVFHQIRLYVKSVEQHATGLPLIVGASTSTAIHVVMKNFAAYAMHYTGQIKDPVEPLFQRSNADYTVVGDDEYTYGPLMSEAVPYTAVNWQSCMSLGQDMLGLHKGCTLLQMLLLYKHGRIMLHTSKHTIPEPLSACAQPASSMIEPIAAKPEPLKSTTGAPSETATEPGAATSRTHAKQHKGVETAREGGNIMQKASDKEQQPAQSTEPGDKNSMATRTSQTAQQRSSRAAKTQAAANISRQLCADRPSGSKPSSSKQTVDAQPGAGTFKPDTHPTADADDDDIRADLSHGNALFRNEALPDDADPSGNSMMATSDSRKMSGTMSEVFGKLVPLTQQLAGKTRSSTPIHDRTEDTKTYSMRPSSRLAVTVTNQRITRSASATRDVGQVDDFEFDVEAHRTLDKAAASKLHTIPDTPKVLHTSVNRSEDVLQHASKQQSPAVRSKLLLPPQVNMETKKPSLTAAQSKVCPDKLRVSTLKPSGLGSIPSSLAVVTTRTTKARDKEAGKDSPAEQLHEGDAKLQAKVLIVMHTEGHTEAAQRRVKTADRQHAKAVGQKLPEAAKKPAAAAAQCGGKKAAPADLENTSREQQHSSRSGAVEAGQKLKEGGWKLPVSDLNHTSTAVQPHTATRDVTGQRLTRSRSVEAGRKLEEAVPDMITGLQNNTPAASPDQQGHSMEPDLQTEQFQGNKQQHVHETQSAQLGTENEAVMSQADGSNSKVVVERRSTRSPHAEANKQLKASEPVLHEHVAEQHVANEDMQRRSRDQNSGQVKEAPQESLVLEPHKWHNTSVANKTTAAGVKRPIPPVTRSMADAQRCASACADGSQPVGTDHPRKKPKHNTESNQGGQHEHHKPHGNVEAMATSGPLEAAKKLPTVTTAKNTTATTRVVVLKPSGHEDQSHQQPIKSNVKTVPDTKDKAQKQRESWRQSQRAHDSKAHGQVSKPVQPEPPGQISVDTIIVIDLLNDESEGLSGHAPHGHDDNVRLGGEVSAGDGGPSSPRRPSRSAKIVARSRLTEIAKLAAQYPPKQKPSKKAKADTDETDANDSDAQSGGHGKVRHSEKQGERRSDAKNIAGKIGSKHQAADISVLSKLGPNTRHIADNSHGGQEAAHACHDDVQHPAKQKDPSKQIDLATAPALGEAAAGVETHTLAAAAAAGETVVKRKSVPPSEPATAQTHHDQRPAKKAKTNSSSKERHKKTTVSGDTDKPHSSAQNKSHDDEVRGVARHDQKRKASSCEQGPAGNKTASAAVQEGIPLIPVEQQVGSSGHEVLDRTVADTRAGKRQQHKRQHASTGAKNLSVALPQGDDAGPDHDTGNAKSPPSNRPTEKITQPVMMHTAHDQQHEHEDALASAQMQNVESHAQGPSLRSVNDQQDADDQHDVHEQTHAEALPGSLHDVGDEQGSDMALVQQNDQAHVPESDPACGNAMQHVDAATWQPAAHAEAPEAMHTDTIASAVLPPPQPPTDEAPNQMIIFLDPSTAAALQAVDQISEQLVSSTALPDLPDLAAIISHVPADVATDALESAYHKHVAEPLCAAMNALINRGRRLLWSQYTSYYSTCRRSLQELAMLYSELKGALEDSDVDWVKEVARKLLRLPM